LQKSVKKREENSSTTVLSVKKSKAGKCDTYVYRQDTDKKKLKEMAEEDQDLLRLENEGKRN